MNTSNKPPLPNYTVTTIRPIFGCLGGNKKIDEERKILDKNRAKIIIKFLSQLNKYRKN